MAKSHKKKSKRLTSRQKYRIIKKGTEHKRKFKKQKKNSKFRKLKDFSIQNILPLKDDVPRWIEQHSQREENLCDAQKDKRLKIQMKNRNIEDLIDETTQKVKDFNMCDDHEAENSSLKQTRYHVEFKKVVENADVVLEILDARDPVGSRCPQVEQLVINRGKILVLVLNKIDLIPKNNLNAWLKCLRQELPTVAFKASIQTENDEQLPSKNLGFHITESLLSSRCCVGASFLLSLLEQYYTNKKIQTSIKVGVIGFPNVGKSSVIRSLKCYHNCSDGETSIINAIKKLSLDKQIEILDFPGIVYAKNESSVTLALRNIVKVEDLEDVITPAEAIVQRVNHTQLCLHYSVPQFSSCHELLCSLAVKMGKFNKAGSLDFEEAARRLINDWNSGKIKYYTHPPQKFIQSEYISVEYVAQMSKLLDMSVEEEQIELDKAPLLFPTISIAAESSEPTDGLIEDKTKTNVHAQTSKSYMLLTKYHLYDLFKNRYKKMKMRKKFDKLALALSESIDASLTLK